MAVALLLSLLAPSSAAAQQTPIPLATSQSPSLLVKLVAGLSPAEQAAVIFRNGGAETLAVPALRLRIIAVASTDVATLLARYLADPAVERAEENRTRVWEAYGDVDPALTGILSGFVAGDGVTATYSRTAGETVAGDPYIISTALSPTAVLANYTIIYNTANFTITKATLKWPPPTRAR